MKNFSNIEIYTFENDVWYKTATGEQRKLDVADRDFIRYMIEHISEFYPKAFAALQDKYKRLSDNIAFYQYKIVWMFCKCNFGIIDNIKDVDSEGGMHFEYISCPLRGECLLEGVVCNPVFNSKISESENRVLKLLFKGVEKMDIADRLCISIHTVNNHIRNAYKRIGVHEKAEFISYANKHNLYGNEG